MGHFRYLYHERDSTLRYHAFAENAPPEPFPGYRRRSFRVSPPYKQKPEKTLWVNSGFCLPGSLMIQFENSEQKVTRLAYR